MSTINFILIVEDDEDWMRIYKEAFKRKFNAEIIGAGNIESALEYLTERNFDLYVTDGDYPLKPHSLVENGAWRILYSKLKEDNNPKVLLISGNEDYKKEAEALDITFISKANYDINEIVRKLEAR